MSKPSISTTEIVEILRDDIVRGDLKPWQRLVEIDLAQRFHVSRTPIREAIKQLAALDLVKLEPYKGAVVADIDMKEITDIYVVRANLEGLATKLATPNLTEMDFEEMERQIQLMNQAREIFNLEQYTRANEAFHNIIFLACGNQYLINTLGDMLARTASFRNTSWSMRSGTRHDVSSNRHGEILEALRKRDADKAQELAEQHIALIHFDI